jgi:hypothetical protein
MHKHQPVSKATKLDPFIPILEYLIKKEQSGQEFYL